MGSFKPDKLIAGMCFLAHPFVIDAARVKRVPAILIMDEMGTPGEGTRPTRWRFCGGCRPGALTRRGVTGP